MLTNAIQSKAKLEEFFQNSSSSKIIDIPELVYIDSAMLHVNGLYLSDNNITEVNLKNMEQQPYRLGGSTITKVNLEHLKEIDGASRNSGTYPLGGYLPHFLYNTKLEKLELPHFLGPATFFPATNIQSGNIQPQQSPSFDRNYWLKDIGLGRDIASIEDIKDFNGLWFRDHYFLYALRLYYPKVIELNRTPEFLIYSTPIGSGNGYIYVPDNLVQDYKQSTSWTELSAKIKGLSEYETDKITFQDTITKSWSEIIADCNTRTMDNSYRVGARKTLYIDGIPYQMTILGLNSDTRADDGSYAMITWGLTTAYDFTPLEAISMSASIARNYSQEGSIHTYLNNLLLNFPAELQAEGGIKEVMKSSYGFNEQGAPNYYQSREKLWAYSDIELGVSTRASVSNLKPYPYFDTTQISGTAPNFTKGATYNDSIRSSMYIPLRDFSSNTNNYPDSLQYKSASRSMEVVSGGSTAPYVVFGFCT